MAISASIYRQNGWLGFPYGRSRSVLTTEMAKTAFAKVAFVFALCINAGKRGLHVLERERGLFCSSNGFPRGKPRDFIYI